MSDESILKLPEEERREIENDWIRTWNQRLLLLHDHDEMDTWITDDEYAYYIEYYRFLRDADKNGLSDALRRSTARVKRRLEAI